MSEAKLNMIYKCKKCFGFTARARERCSWCEALLPEKEVRLIPVEKFRSKSEMKRIKALKEKKKKEDKEG